MVAASSGGILVGNCSGCQGAKVKRVMKCVLGVFLLLASGVPASAAIVTYELNLEFSGGTAPEGTAPWLRASFADVLGGVQLTMSSGLSGTEFASGWYFNFDPTRNAAGLGFSYVSGVMASSPVSTGINAFKADGDGYFDIKFKFAANDFGQNDKSVYLITGSDLDVYDFKFSSVQGGGNGTYYSAAHVQSIGTDGEGSGWIGAPEPGSPVVPLPAAAWLLGSGLLGLGVMRGRMKKRA